MLRRPFVWAAIGSLFLDQVAKVAVHGRFDGGLSVPAGGVRVLGDVLRLVYEQNRHGVFGLEYGPRFLYYVLPAMGSLLVVWFGLRARGAWLATAYGLVLGGAIGNLIDRVRFGYVIDFIVVELPRIGFRWYTFNFADASLVAGVIMLLGHEFFARRRPAGAGSGSQPDGNAPGLPRQ